MKRRPLTQEKSLRIDKALKVRAHSVPELAAIADVRGETVRRYLDPLYRHEFVHIGAWANRRTPMFKAGEGADAKRPKPLSAAQRMAKSRAGKA